MHKRARAGRRRGKRAFLTVLFLLCFFFAFLGFSASAAEDGTADTIGQEIEDLFRRYLDTVPEGTDPGISPDDREGSIGSLGFGRLLGSLFSALEGRRGAIGTFLLTLAGTVLLFALSEMWESGDHTSSAVAAVLAVPVFSVVAGAVAEVREGLTAASGFLSGALPVLSAITLAGGGGGTAAVQAAGLGLTLSVTDALTVELLLPLATAMFAFSLLSALDTAGSLSSFAAGMRSVFLWGIGVVAAVLTASLSLQTVIASAADGFSLRAARFAASDLIPVVGGAVSGALSTLASGIAYVRSTVGVSAVVVLFLILGAPLLELLIYRTALSLSSSLLALFGARRGSALFAAFRSALDCVIAVYAVTSFMFILQIVLFLLGGASS